jgi:hypothetical protein
MAYLRLIDPLKIVIFDNDVSLPEGNPSPYLHPMMWMTHEVPVRSAS